MFMKEVYERLRDARKKLGLSQEYVARSLGISRSAVTQIEQGKRNISVGEIAGFCNLYHISADRLLRIEASIPSQAVFARGFESLNEDDQREILNLIAFKKEMGNR